MRESNVDEFLTRGREFRRELMAILVAEGIGHVVSEPKPIADDRRKRGLLGSGASWMLEQLAAASGDTIATLDRDSPLLDLVFATALEALEMLGDPDRWFVPAPPHTMIVGRSRKIRIGVFTWATDADAFAEALLGRPVPRHPRYAARGPAEALDLVGREALDWAELWGIDLRAITTLWGLGAERARRESAALLPAVRRAGGDDQAVSGLFAAVAKEDPQAFARSPFGRLLLPIARGAPGWRKRPEVEWIWSADLGILGAVGFAWWIPGDASLRHHRAAYAGHLRYLFDHHVAPWRRHKDPRSQREAFLICQLPRAAALAEPETHVTIKQLADFARRTWPDSYLSERSEVTLRRMYRLSARKAGGNSSAS